MQTQTYIDDLDYPIPFEDMLILEREHKEEIKQLNKETDWFVVFPEAVSIIPDKIQEFIEELIATFYDWHECLQSLEEKQLADLDRYFLETWYKALHLPRVELIAKRVFNLKRSYEKHLALTNPQSQENDPYRITDITIANAKEVSIAELFARDRHKLKRQGKNYSTLCPFHQESTPSCTLYVESNTYFCFGCGAWGDSIEYIKRTRKINFIEAVRWLTGGHI